MTDTKKPPTAKRKGPGGPSPMPNDLPYPTKGHSRPGDQRPRSARAGLRQEKGSRKPGHELPRDRNR